MGTGQSLSTRQALYELLPDYTFLLSVKAIDTLRIALPLKSRPSTTILSSVSSDGTIHVYDLHSLPQSSQSDNAKVLTEIEPVARYDSNGSRLTCVALADGESVDDSHVAGEKRKRDHDGDNHEDEEWPSDQQSSESSGSASGEDE